MSIILRNYIKSILIEGSRFINFPKKDINPKKLSAEYKKTYGEQNKFNQQKFNLKRNLDSFNDFLIDIASPNTFITFVDKYNSKTPGFSLNPFAEFNTPHGFYFYPFDKKNAFKFINDGSPTYSEFAIDRKYFHLVKIDINHPNVFVIGPNGTENKPKLSSYEFDNKLTEICRIILTFFYQKKSNQKILNDFIDEIYLFLNNKEFRSLLFNKIMHKNVIKDGYFILYKIPNLIQKFKYFNLPDDFVQENFKILNSLVHDFDNEITNNFSIFYSLVLNSIGIKCLIDKGTSTIHSAEPSQAHIITFSEDNSFYEYIGTYPNIPRLEDDFDDDIDINDSGSIVNWVSKFFKNTNINELKSTKFAGSIFFDKIFIVNNDYIDFQDLDEKSLDKLIFDEKKEKNIKLGKSIFEKNMLKLPQISSNINFRFKFFKFILNYCDRLLDRSSILKTDVGYEYSSSKSLKMNDIELLQYINEFKNEEINDIKNDKNKIKELRYILSIIYPKKNDLFVINELKNNPIKNLDFFNDKELLFNIIEYYHKNYNKNYDNMTIEFKKVISLYSLLDNDIKRDNNIKEAILNFILDKELYYDENYYKKGSAILLDFFKKAYETNNQNLLNSCKEIYNNIQFEFLNSDLKNII